MACTLGYLPEVLSYIIAGKFLDNHPGYEGYHMNFLYMIAMGIIGLVISIIWARTYGKKAKMKQAEDMSEAVAEVEAIAEVEAGVEAEAITE